MNGELSDSIQQTFLDSIKMSFFYNFKTNNVILDTIVSTLIVVVVSYVIKRITSSDTTSINLFRMYNGIKSLFCRKYSITYKGTQTFIVNKYDLQPAITVCFSDCFKALFYDIIKKMRNNKSIFEIQEYITSYGKRYSEDKIEADMYIIKQEMPILYNSELKIYAITEITKEDSDPDKKTTIKTDQISITLYSYESNISKIQDFVEDIKTKYLCSIENDRKGKRFIYSLKSQPKEDDDGGRQLWNETLFESTRTFSNMFFEGKEDILDKINYFLSNKDWYYSNGIPYTLGIGLYGPPGTGKTSFFKSLANLTGRHLVILSLKLVKTKQQLEEYFFENRYNLDNKKSSIGFDKKIIIIEDIDCLGDVVWKREKEPTKKKSKKNSSPKDQIGAAITKLIENNNNEKKEFIDLCKEKEEDPITLDDILNLWDGIKETPGRILGISSNHYDKLDHALIRPGRIDITLCLDNCTRSMIRQMYKQYYKCDIEESSLNKIKDRFYSPAEIINCYVLNRIDSKAFLVRLLENKKF